MKIWAKSVAIVCAVGLAACAPVTSPAELATVSAATPASIKQSQITLTDEAGHRFSAEILHPAIPGTYPLILFSSGNFASPDRYRKLLEPVAAAGYVIVSPVHRDAEILALDPPAGQDEVWHTRNAEFAHLATIPAVLSAQLDEQDIALEPGKLGLFGHSYGALIAQLGAGARALGPEGEITDHTLVDADVLVAYSPPGPFPGRFDAEGWSSIGLPSLTLTGTADVTPGFVDDWRDHIVSHDATAPGARWLWVGEGVDHYFNGTFGREKPVPAQMMPLFDDALATTIAFFDLHLKDISPPPRTLAAGVTLTKDSQ